MFRRVLLIAVASLAFTACHRQRKPSPYYEEASKAFSDLYAQKLDDAYLDPQMDAIEAELKRVPKDSLDYQPAQSLIARIDEGRTKQAALAKANAAKPEGPPPEPEFDWKPPPEPDAGPSQPVVGMPKKEFLARFSDCFQSQGSAQAKAPDGGMSPVEMFVLAPTDDCAQRFPRFKTRFVLTDAARITGTALRSSLKEVPNDGGVPRASSPDAG